MHVHTHTHLDLVVLPEILFPLAYLICGKAGMGVVSYEKLLQPWIQFSWPSIKRVWQAWEDFYLHQPCVCVFWKQISSNREKPASKRVCISLVFLLKIWDHNIVPSTPITELEWILGFHECLCWNLLVGPTKAPSQPWGIAGVLTQTQSLPDVCCCVWIRDAWPAMDARQERVSHSEQVLLDTLPGFDKLRSRMQK